MSGTLESPYWHSWGPTKEERIEALEAKVAELVPDVVELPIDTPHIGAIIAEMERRHAEHFLHDLARANASKLQPMSDALARAMTQEAIAYWEMERERHRKKGAHSIPDPYGRDGDAWKGWADALDWGEPRPESPGNYDSPDHGLLRGT